LSKDFAQAMIEIIRENDFLRQVDIIIAVPLNIFRRLKRGYNQAQLLAEYISKEIGKPCLCDILYRKKMTKAQFKLSKIERNKNIKDSFYCKKSPLLSKKTVLLIDDIATTAATVSACAKILKKAGAKKVFVLTLARD
jgi:ComF family protein